MATVMVVGSGGREMAQAVALAKSDKVAKVVCCPGNGGTATGNSKIANVAIKDTAVDEVVAYAKKNSVALVAIGITIVPPALSGHLVRSRHRTPVKTS